LKKSIIEGTFPKSRKRERPKTAWITSASSFYAVSRPEIVSLLRTMTTFSESMNNWVSTACRRT